MKNETTNIIHGRMISICLTTVMLLGLSFSQMTQAQVRTIVYDYTGTFTFNTCTGLDGASFHWVGSFDADATRVFSGTYWDQFGGGGHFAHNYGRAQPQQQRNIFPRL